jgi:hypothetical protein
MRTQNHNTKSNVNKWTRSKASISKEREASGCKLLGT